jgi:hypothetical protein
LGPPSRDRTAWILVDKEASPPAHDAKGSASSGWSRSLRTERLSARILFQCLRRSRTFRFRRKGDAVICLPCGQGRSCRFGHTRGSISHTQGLLAVAVSPLALAMLLAALVRLLVLGLSFPVQLALGLLATAVAAITLPPKAALAHAKDDLAPVTLAPDQLDEISTRHRR